MIRCVTARRANRSKPVHPSREKYTASRLTQITTTTPAIPRSQEGRIAIVTDVGCGERWPRRRGRATGFRRAGFMPVSESRARRTRWRRTAKPCGSGTRCWCQAGGGNVDPTGFRQSFNPPAMEAKGIRLQGERGISRQTIAQGMPECSSCTCMLVCVFFALIAHETAGAASTRHSLRPLLDGRMILQSSGMAPRER